MTDTQSMTTTTVRIHDRQDPVAAVLLKAGWRDAVTQLLPVNIPEDYYNEPREGTVVSAVYDIHAVTGYEAAREIASLFSGVAVERLVGPNQWKSL